MKLAGHWLLYNQGELTGVADVEQTRQFLLAGQQLAPNNTRAELEVPITIVEVPETVAQGTAGIGGAEAPQSFSLPTPLQEDRGPQPPPPGPPGGPPNGPGRPFGGPPDDPGDDDEDDQSDEDTSDSEGPRTGRCTGGKGKSKSVLPKDAALLPEKVVYANSTVEARDVG